MADNILLNCSILFGIRISPSGIVDDLKDAIKRKLTRELEHIPLVDLMFGRQAIPRNMPAPIADVAHLQVLNPVLSDERSSMVQTSRMHFSLNLWRSCHLTSLNLQSQRCFTWLYKSSPSPGEYQPFAPSCPHHKECVTAISCCLCFPY
jgi:hypothetical protein